MSELEEMRQWLRRRDEDRRQQGIMVPDTVEQLEPPGDVTVRRRQWPERLAPAFGSGRTFGDITDQGQPVGEQSGRVRDTLDPRFADEGLSDGAPQTGRHRYATSQRRHSHHRGSGSGRSRAKGSTHRRH